MKIRVFFIFAIIFFLTSVITFAVKQIPDSSKNESKTQIILASSTPTPFAGIDSEKLFQLVNAYRVQNGLQPLTKNETLCDFGRIRLQQIQNDWSHTQFYPLVQTYFSGKRNSGVVSENLSKGYKYEKDALSSWLHSPLHLRNIKDPSFSSSCIVGDNYYSVEIFANF